MGALTPGRGGARRYGRTIRARRCGLRQRRPGAVAGIGSSAGDRRTGSRSFTGLISGGEPSCAVLAAARILADHTGGARRQSHRRCVPARFGAGNLGHAPAGAKGSTWRGLSVSPLPCARRRAQLEGNRCLLG